MALCVWKRFCDADLPHPGCSLLAWVLTEPLEILDLLLLQASLQPAKLQAGEREKESQRSTSQHGKNA